MNHLVSVSKILVKRVQHIWMEIRIGNPNYIIHMLVLMDLHVYFVSKVHWMVAALLLLMVHRVMQLVVHKEKSNSVKPWKLHLHNGNIILINLQRVDTGMLQNVQDLQLRKPQWLQQLVFMKMVPRSLQVRNHSHV